MKLLITSNTGCRRRCHARDIVGGP